MYNSKPRRGDSGMITSQGKERKNENLKRRKHSNRYKDEIKLGMEVHTCNPSNLGLRRGYCKSEASPGNLVRPWVKI
jgi:hypothetical protein